MNRVLFWDFDGTLVYCHHLWSNSVLTVLRENGVSADLDEVRPYMATGYPWDIVKMHTELKNGAWWPYLYRKFASVYRAFGIAPETADSLGPHTRDLILDITKYFLYDDTYAVLEEAQKRGWSNIILSNNYPELRQTANKLGLTPYFSDFVISGEIGLDKPQPEIFKYAWNLSGKPEQCYMIGDNPYADVEGAMRTGIPAILVHRTVPSKAVHSFETLTELLSIL